MPADVTFTIEAIDRASSALTGIRGAFLSLNQAMGVANQVMRTANQIIEETIGEYVKYADEVRTLTQLTNQSAEDMSRLIQVADDYKISVDDLTVASRKLATEGLSLNVETIADLSDQYLSLNTGAERQLFLTDNLGRSSTAWTDIMVQGSTAILARNAAISDMLILDQQALDATRNYEYALDDFQDSVMGVKVALGSWLLPALISVMDYVGNSIAGWEQFANTLGVIIETVKGLTIPQMAANIVKDWQNTAANVVSGVFPTIKPHTAIFSGHASGGSVSGRYAITGDSLSGRRTGYEELVDFQQKRVYSAPQTQAMGVVPRYAAGSGGIELSPQTIQNLAAALKYELAPFL